MDTTTLSSKGQVILPKWLRDAHEWEPGLEFVVIDTGDGVLLKPSRPFPSTTLLEVVGSLTHTGQSLTIEQMDDGLRKAIEETGDDRG